MSLVAWTTRAEAAPFDLHWSAPAECPSRDAIVDATRARLGEENRTAPPELFIEGTVRAHDGGFLATLVLSDASGQLVGERELRVPGRDCAAIEEPVSLVLAMVIATLRPHQATPADAGRAAMPRARTPATARSAAATEATGARERPPRFFVGAGATTSYGVLPDIGLGAALRAIYSPKSIFYVGLEASFEVGGSAHVGTGHIGFQLIDGSARVGLQALRSHRFELIPTLGARAGVIRAPSSGFTRSFGNETRAIVVAGPGVLGRVRLAGNVFLEALPELEIVFIRDDFQGVDRGKLYSVHRARPADVRLAFGIGYDFR